MMDSPTEIKPVQNKSELDTFIKFPYKLYRGGKIKYDKWVPPLLMAERDLLNQNKDPFYKHADCEHYLAYKDGNVVGRVSSIIDHEYNKYHNANTGYFGFYESIEDESVAKQLIAAASSWLKDRGISKMMGPINPSPNHELGTLINNFETPSVVQMPYNAPYYNRILKSTGLEKEKDLFSYVLDKSQQPSDKIKRVAELAKKRSKIRLRKVDLKDFDELVEIIRYIYNDAWSDNWGFVPWTKEEFAYLAKDLKLILIPELVLLAYKDDKPVGFALPLPDINQILIKMNGRLFPTGIFKLLLGKKKIDFVRIAVFGVLKEYQNMGIDGLLVYELYNRGVNLGMNGADFSWILEDNMKLRNMLEKWGAKHYKTHRIYSLKL